MYVFPFCPLPHFDKCILLRQHFAFKERGELIFVFFKAMLLLDQSYSRQHQPLALQMRRKKCVFPFAKQRFNFPGVFITRCHVAVTWPHEPLPAIKADKSLIYRKRRRCRVRQRGNEGVTRERERNNELPVALRRYFILSYFKLWSWMLLCLGSVVWTVASEAHWLLQAETKRQMVVVCVVYCDCDPTALLYLLLESERVFTCAAECTTAQANAFVSRQRRRCRKTLRTQPPLPFLSLLGYCWWISPQSKQESKHIDGSACSNCTHQTRLGFHYQHLFHASFQN